MKLRFIGHSPRPGTAVVTELPAGAVKLSYAQQRLMPPSAVMAVLNTSDRGGPGRRPKRWYNWFSTPGAIASCHAATTRMKMLAA